MPRAVLDDGSARSEPGSPVQLQQLGIDDIAGQGEPMSTSEPIVYIDHSQIREEWIDELRAGSNGSWISSTRASLS